MVTPFICCTHGWFTTFSHVALHTRYAHAHITHAHTCGYVPCVYTPRLCVVGLVCYAVLGYLPFGYPVIHDSCLRSRLVTARSTTTGYLPVVCGSGSLPYARYCHAVVGYGLRFVRGYPLLVLQLYVVTVLYTTRAFCSYGSRSTVLLPVGLLTHHLRSFGYITTPHRWILRFLPPLRSPTYAVWLRLPHSRLVARARTGRTLLRTAPYGSLPLHARFRTAVAHVYRCAFAARWFAARRTHRAFVLPWFLPFRLVLVTVARFSSVRPGWVTTVLCLRGSLPGWVLGSVWLDTVHTATPVLPSYYTGFAYILYLAAV